MWYRIRDLEYLKNQQGQAEAEEQQELEEKDEAISEALLESILQDIRNKVCMKFTLRLKKKQYNNSEFIFNHDEFNHRLLCINHCLAFYWHTVYSFVFGDQSKSFSF